MYKHILLPTDGSARPRGGRRALLLSLARHCQFDTERDGRAPSYPTVPELAHKWLAAAI